MGSLGVNCAISEGKEVDRPLGYAPPKERGDKSSLRFASNVLCYLASFEAVSDDVRTPAAHSGVLPPATSGNALWPPRLKCHPRISDRNTVVRKML